MSIITDWNEILTNTTTIWGTVNAPRVINRMPVWGMFGNGMQVISTVNPELNTPIADWSGIRFNDFTIPLDGTKVVLSAVFLIPRISNTAQFSIGAVGLMTSTVASVTSGMSGMVILDGRNTAASNPSSSAYQIRNKSINSSEVVYGEAAEAGVLASTDYYRIELEIVTTAARTDMTIIGRWYRHGTNELLNTGTATIDKPASGVVLRPCILTFREGWCDNAQIQIGDEPYLSNMPIKARIGSAWVRKPAKKWNGTAWVPFYPKAQKSGQWIW